MRIDRHAFWLAVAALGGCERDPAPTRAAPVASTSASVAATSASVAATAAKPPAGVSARLRQATPLEPPAMPAPTPAPAPAPRPTVRHAHLSAAKQWFLGLTLTQRGTVTDVCVHRVEVGCHKMLEAEMPAPVAPDEPNEDSQDSNEPNVDSFEAKGPRMSESIESRSEMDQWDRHDASRRDLRTMWTRRSLYARSGAC
jgi:hypothetical protein